MFSVDLLLLCGQIISASNDQCSLFACSNFTYINLKEIHSKCCSYVHMYYYYAFKYIIIFF